MSHAAPAARRVRFGVFELDLAAGELRKDGRTAPLQDLPFRLLALLVQRPGEVVTREEVRQALWPDGTFVEFEHGVNTAVNKIRQALGDSAHNPRFIETLPRKGYRFIAPVAGAEVPAAPAAVPSSRRRWLRTAALITAAFVAGVVAFRAWHKDPGAAEAGLVAVPLTSYPGAEDSPSFSPDGTQVAFEWCREGSPCQIYVKQIGVEQPSRLTDHPAGSFGPAWSPDGQSIAFLRDVSPARTALLLIPQRGGPERVLAEFDRLLWRGEFQFGPYLAWSPDQKWLAATGWERNDQLGLWTLFLVSPNTGEKRKLTNPRVNRVGGDTAPAFSPDGRSLVFTRRGFDVAELYLLGLAGDGVAQGEPERIAVGKPDIFGAAWTLAGGDLVFSSGSSAASGLWRMAPSKSASPRTLGFPVGQASGPAISRKGNRLAYVVPRANSSIWRVEVGRPGEKTGGPARFLSSTQRELVPSYSRDGGRIAVLSNRSGAWELWACGSDGANRVQLTTFGGAIIIGQTWSPDGQSIVLSRTAAENQDLYVISSGGGLPRRLTTHPETDKWPCWSRDGRWIYFTSPRTGRDEIWKMPPAGGEAIQVTRNGGDVPEESPDRKFLYYQKGWPVETSVWRMPVDGGEETKLLDSVHHSGQWTVGEAGIYYFTVPDAQGRSDLNFYEFATGKTRKVVTAERPPSYRITLSPDGHTILYPQVDETGSDLMLVENFR